MWPRMGCSMGLAWRAGGSRANPPSGPAVNLSGGAAPATAAAWRCSTSDPLPPAFVCRGWRGPARRSASVQVGGSFELFGKRGAWQTLDGLAGVGTERQLLPLALSGNSAPAPSCPSRSLRQQLPRLLHRGVGEELPAAGRAAHLPAVPRSLGGRRGAGGGGGGRRIPQPGGCGGGACAHTGGAVWWVGWMGVGWVLGAGCG